MHGRVALTEERLTCCSLAHTPLLMTNTMCAWPLSATSAVTTLQHIYPSQRVKTSPTSSSLMSAPTNRDLCVETSKANGGARDMATTMDRTALPFTPPHSRRVQGHYYELRRNISPCQVADHSSRLVLRRGAGPSRRQANVKKRVGWRRYPKASRKSILCQVCCHNMLHG